MKKVLVFLFMSISILGYSQDSLSTSNLDASLAKVVEKSLILAEKTGQFVLDEAPDLIKQFLTYEAIENCFWFLVSLIIFIFTWRGIFSKKGRKWVYDNDLEMLYVLGGVLLIVFGIFMVDSLLDLIKIIVAPKIYIIEYFVQ